MLIVMLERRSHVIRDPGIESRLAMCFFFLPRPPPPPPWHLLSSVGPCSGCEHQRELIVDFVMIRFGDESKQKEIVTSRKCGSVAPLLEQLGRGQVADGSSAAGHVRAPAGAYKERTLVFAP